MSGMPAGSAFDRVCTLSLSGSSGAGGTVIRYDESEGNCLSMDFEIESHTLQSPSLACFVLKNVSAATAAKVQKEFTEITFTAGYRYSSEGELFRGTIVETQYGEKTDNNTTTLLRIWCACSDLAYKHGRVNTSLGAGSTHKDIVDACLKGMQAAQPSLSMGSVVGVDLSAVRFPRGLTLAGLARDYLRETCLSLGATFTLFGNKLSILSTNAPGTGSSGVVLTPDTILGGPPIQRLDGVIVSCLINPAIDLNTTITIKGPIVSPNVTGNAIVPGSIDKQGQLANQLNAKGDYRVIHMLTRGSTRGPDWTMTLTTIGVGQNVNTTQAGLGYS